MHKLRHWRESYGLTVADLSELSDISVDVIHRIESGHNPYKVNETTAQALANALYLQVEDLFDKSELSHLGRPPHTGKPIGTFQLIKEHEMLCDGCNLVVPKAVGCQECVAA